MPCTDHMPLVGPPTSRILLALPLRSAKSAKVIALVFPDCGFHCDCGCSEVCPEQLPRNLPCWHPLALCLCPNGPCTLEGWPGGYFSLCEEYLEIRSCLRVKYIAMHARIGSPSMRYVLYKILAGQLLGALMAHCTSSSRSKHAAVQQGETHL